MYPHGELAELQRRKAALRRRIAASRVACTVHAAGVMRPLRWIDQAVAWWRQLQPLVRLTAVPLGFLAVRSFGRRFRLMGALLRWGPLALNVLRGLTRSAPGTTASRGAR